MRQRAKITTKSTYLFPDNSMNCNLGNSFSLTHSGKSTMTTTCFYRLIAVRVNSCFTHLCYFLSLSFFGYSVLKSLNHKPPGTTLVPRNIDFFFTAVSASTDSSLSTIEMEVFSDSQLLFIAFLMFVGGEVFISLISLIITTTHPSKWEMEHAKNISDPTSIPRMLELGRVVVPLPADHHNDRESNKFLCSMVLGYMIVMHVLGVLALWVYLIFQKSARDILSEKGLRSFTFSLFTSVSSFASCGFIPTNENMIVFRNMSGMLLVLIPQVLMGNAMLFPHCIWMLVWAAGKLFPKKYGECSRYLLTKNDNDDHEYDDDKTTAGRVVLPGRHSRYLAGTVAGLFVVQLVMICGLDWDSEGMKGMNSFQKLVGWSFMAVNSRHAGESVVDLSTLSPAVLVVFLVMMYLPPCTSFIPVAGKQKEEYSNSNPHSKRTGRPGNDMITENKRNNAILENVLPSQLSIIIVFVAMVCIIERENMQNDPLNFNVFNIALEVVSAYGNVGFSMGYSCKRQINPTGSCEDKWYGFSGRWSDGGKIVLILVMVFGRLKKFNIHGGKAWKLL